MPIISLWFFHYSTIPAGRQGSPLGIMHWIKFEAQEDTPKCRWFQKGSHRRFVDFPARQMFDYQMVIGCIQLSRNRVLLAKLLKCLLNRSFVFFCGVILEEKNASLPGSGKASKVMHQNQLTFGVTARDVNLCEVDPRGGLALLFVDGKLSTGQIWAPHVKNTNCLHTYTTGA